MLIPNQRCIRNQLLSGIRIPLRFRPTRESGQFLVNFVSVLVSILVDLMLDKISLKLGC
jgi:hypothetical protein